MDYRIGVDIGGTSVKLGVVSEDLALAEVSRIPTGKHASAEAIITSIIDGCRKLQEKYNVVSIGIGSAGRVNPKLGVVEIAGNLPFRGEPIAARRRSCNPPRSRPGPRADAPPDEEARRRTRSQPQGRQPYIRSSAAAFPQSHANATSVANAVAKPTGHASSTRLKTSPPMLTTQTESQT